MRRRQYRSHRIPAEVFQSQSGFLSILAESNEHSRSCDKKTIGIKLCLQVSQTITYPLQIFIARKSSSRCHSSVILMVELPALFRARVIMIVTSQGERGAAGMFVTRKHVSSFQIKGRQYLKLYSLNQLAET